MKCLIFVSLVSIVFGQEKSGALDGRIIGGQDANIADYPYQISLQLLSSHICGGAIISSTWIITAAHCVVDAPLPSYLSVRAGSSTRNSGGQVYSVVKAITHPSYNVYANYDYDIALLQLSSSISTTNANVISLASSGTGPAANLTTTVTGWGLTTVNGVAATTLQVVQVPVISQTNCNVVYPNLLTDRMFCAGILETGGKDSCQGDSGGPLAINGTLYGLVSWGYGCAQANSPGVYTNLQVLRDWITTNSGV